jgi:hypothetical protein
VKLEKWNPPWRLKPLDDWAIAGMHHYQVGHFDNRVRLSVVMMKDGRCIAEDGLDDVYLWDRLRNKAVKAAAEAAGGGE